MIFVPILLLNMLIAMMGELRPFSAEQTVNKQANCKSPIFPFHHPSHPSALLSLPVFAV